MGQPFLLFGQHRSGTSLLHNLIKCHAMADSINEPFSQHVPLFRDSELDPWSAQDLGIRALHPSIPVDSYLHTYIINLRRWLWAELPGVRGFKETFLLHKLSWIDAALGPLRGVLILRDPRATIASLIRNNLLESWWEYARLGRRYRAGRPQFEQFDVEDPVVAASIVWTVRTEIVQQYATQNEWLILRLEDLLADPRTTIEELMGHLGLIPDPRQMALLEETWRSDSAQDDSTFSYFRSPGDVIHKWREELSPSQANTITAIAKRVMERLNYDV